MNFHEVTVDPSIFDRLGVSPSVFRWPFPIMAKAGDCIRAREFTHARCFGEYTGRERIMTVASEDGSCIAVVPTDPAKADTSLWPPTWPRPVDAPGQPILDHQRAAMHDAGADEDRLRTKLEQCGKRLDREVANVERAHGDLEKMRDERDALRAHIAHLNKEKEHERSILWQEVRQARGEAEAAKFELAKVRGEVAKLKSEPHAAKEAMSWTDSAIDLDAFRRTGAELQRVRGGLAALREERNGLAYQVDVRTMERDEALTEQAAVRDYLSFKQCEYNALLADARIMLDHVEKIAETIAVTSAPAYQNASLRIKAIK